MLIASTAEARCLRRRGLAASLLCSTPVRALGTALGLLLLVRAVNVPAAARQLADVRPGWIAAGTALTGVSIGLGMLSWAVLLRGSCARLEPGALVSLYLRALFVGQLVPGGVGGDAVRVVETGRLTGTGRALAAVVGGRLAGALGIALWGAFAALTMRDRLDDTLGYLPAAVESMLSQTLEDLEVVVVDDGSTDGTPEALREIPDPRIRLFEPPAGPMKSESAGRQAKKRCCGTSPPTESIASSRAPTRSSRTRTHSAGGRRGQSSICWS